MVTSRPYDGGVAIDLLAHVGLRLRNARTVNVERLDERRDVLQVILDRSANDNGMP